jgi:hypothetical protein
MKVIPETLLVHQIRYLRFYWNNSYGEICLPSILSTNDWHSNGYKLCSTTLRFISTCLRGRLPSMASRPLRNIYISNDNGSFTFCVDFYHSSLTAKTWLYIWVTRQVSDKKQELLTLREHFISPRVFWWCPFCSSFKFFVLSYYVSLRY